MPLIQLVFSGFLTAVLGFVPTAWAQPQGHGGHPLMPDQRLVVQCRFSQDGEVRTVQAELNLPMNSAPAQLDQAIALPAPLPAVRAVEYLPSARMEQNVEPATDGTGLPAVHVSVDGAKQHYKRWLVGGDDDRNRLVSFIATWRYMVVKDQAERDELLSQFKNEFTRDPVLTLSARDGQWSRQLRVAAGAKLKLSEADCQVRIKEFFPDFAMGEEGSRPVNQSDRRLNPAVLLEVEQGGRRVERWIFAKFPDFKMHDSPDLPFEVELDCPVEKESSAPDFVLVTKLPDHHEAWVRHAEKVSTQPLALQEKVAVPGANYTFHVERYVAAGLLEEQYVPATGRGVPAVKIAGVDGTGKAVSLWLELGKERHLDLGQGRVAVALLLKQPQSTGDHR